MASIIPVSQMPEYSKSLIGSNDYLYVSEYVNNSYVSKKISLSTLKSILGVSSSSGGGDSGGSSSGGGDSGTTPTPSYTTTHTITMYSAFDSEYTLSEPLTTKVKSGYTMNDTNISEVTPDGYVIERCDDMSRGRYTYDLGTKKFYMDETLYAKYAHKNKTYSSWKTVPSPTNPANSVLSCN